MTNSRESFGIQIENQHGIVHDMGKSKACTGHQKSNFWSHDVDLETKEECNILSVNSMSFREQVNERLRAVLNRP